MTANQRKYFYFPAWRKCAAALRWTMQKGRLQADLADQVEEARMYCRPENHSPGWDQRLQVIDTAEHPALQQHRAATADDLRHACTWLVSNGRTTESGKLKQAEIGRCVHLFDILRDPDNLQAIDNWENQEDAEQRSFVRFLEQQDARTLSAIRAIAGERWNDGRAWNFRPMADLKWLWSQVRERAKTTKRTTSHCPF